MLTLYQAEWCPFSHQVRYRLTELGVDFVAKQVEADPRARTAMRDATGAATIPVLVADDGTVVRNADEIVAWLDERFSEREDVERHRARAAVDMPDW